VAGADLQFSVVMGQGGVLQKEINKGVDGIKIKRFMRSSK